MIWRSTGLEEYCTKATFLSSSCHIKTQQMIFIIRHSLMLESLGSVSPLSHWSPTVIAPPMLNSLTYMFTPPMALRCSFLTQSVCSNNMAASYGVTPKMAFLTNRYVRILHLLLNNSRKLLIRLNLSLNIYVGVGL